MPIVSKSRPSKTPRTPARAPIDVSIILPFRDDEDVVGTACSKLANHLRGLGLTFELLAVEEDSGDNSHAVLGLLRDQIAELQVHYASSRDRGFATGAELARGRAVLLIDATSAVKPLAPLARAVRQVLDGDKVAVFAPERFAVCHRTQTLGALSHVRGRRLAAMRRRVGNNGAVEVIGARKRRWLNPRSRGAGSADRRLGWLLGALLLR